MVYVYRGIYRIPISCLYNYGVLSKEKLSIRCWNSWTFDGTPMIASTIRTRWILVNIFCELNFIFTICTNQYYRFTPTNYFGFSCFVGVGENKNKIWKLWKALFERRKALEVYGSLSVSCLSLTHPGMTVQRQLEGIWISEWTLRQCGSYNLLESEKRCVSV